MTVGETFTLELKATGPARARRYTFPGEAVDRRARAAHADGSAAGGRELRRLPRPARTATRRPSSRSADAEVPPIPVRYRLPDGTDGRGRDARRSPLKVVSLLPKDAEEQKLADIRGPVPGRHRPRRSGSRSAARARCSWPRSSSGCSRRRRTQRGARRRGRAAPVPPDVEALRALDALAAAGPARRAASYRAFYIALTAVAKRYLERRLDGADPRDDDGGDARVPARPPARPTACCPVVRDLAEAADRIKFARGEGLAAEAERHLAAVRALVRTLEARLRRRPRMRPEGKAA